jgi:hypothetical protein
MKHHRNTVEISAAELGRLFDLNEALRCEPLMESVAVDSYEVERTGDDANLGQTDDAQGYDRSSGHGSPRAMRRTTPGNTLAL